MMVAASWGVCMIYIIHTVYDIRNTVYIFSTIYCTVLYCTILYCGSSSWWCFTIRWQLSFDPVITLSVVQQMGIASYLTETRMVRGLSQTSGLGKSPCTCTCTAAIHIAWATSFRLLLLLLQLLLLLGVQSNALTRGHGGSSRSSLRACCPRLVLS